GAGRGARARAGRVGVRVRDRGGGARRRRGRAHGRPLHRGGRARRNRGEATLTVFYLLAGLVGGAILGVLLGRAFARKTAAGAERLAETQAAAILEAARAEADSLKKEAQVEGKELAFKVKADVEEEIRRKKAEGAKKEEAVAAREEELGRRGREAQRREEDLGRRERQIAGREQAAESMAQKAGKSLDEAKARLERVAGMTAAEARKELAAQVIDEAKKLAAGEVKRIEAAAREEAAEKAKKVIATAVQRYASEYVAERTVSVVPLPSDDMKGRLIGREGRNVRALEAATGTDLIIDDTPECITISCFNPVRREVARLAIGRLVADGRIHPTRIEEVVQK